MNVACDYEAPIQMLTTEKYIAARVVRALSKKCHLCGTQYWLWYLVKLLLFLTSGLIIMLGYMVGEAG